MSKLSRKEFLSSIAKTAAALAAIPLVAACGGDDGGDGDGGDTGDQAAGDCLANGTEVTIVGNHGHVLMVSMADVEAGEEKVYDITAQAGHTHMVTVTAANFASLQAGDPVSVTSTNNGTHMHTINIACA